MNLLSEPLQPQSPLHGRVRYLLLALLLLLALYNGWRGVSLVGESCDEPVQRAYGKAILAFHESTGYDTRALSFSNLRLYGGGFDLLGAALEKRFADVDYNRLRHTLSMLCGVLGLVFAYLLALRFGGPWAGLLAAAMLACTPRWMGHSLFNPKDIPFATTYLAAIYFGVRVIDLATPLRWLAFGLACGACLSVRIGGVFPLAFLLLFVRRPGWLAALGIAYLVAGLSWPYLSSNPINHTLFVLWQNAHFRWDGPMVFGGEVIQASDAGRLYIPTWFAITSPLFFVLAPLGAWRLRGTPAGRFVLLSALFLPLFAIVMRSRVYDEVRQFLFVVPFLACFAALAARRWVMALAVIAMLEPAWWIATSAPYTYTYFNPLVGGLRDASWRYESDYWWVTERQAAEWCNANAAGKAVYLGDTEKETFTAFLDPSKGITVVDDPAQAQLHVLHNRYRLPSELPKDVLYQYAPVLGQAPFFVITGREAD